jgi:membrane protease YdiL (CAAX protease family)
VYVAIPKALGGLPAVLIACVKILIAAAAMFLGGVYSKTGFKREGLGKGVLLGWLFLLWFVTSCAVSFITIDKTFLYFPGIQKIIAFTFSMLAIGVSEELICRGIILNIFLDRWGNTKRAIVLSVVLSSVIFGLGHIGNFISRPYFVMGTIEQIIVAAIAGFYFACIYLRSRNIGSVILLHTLQDWFSMIPGEFVNMPNIPATETAADMPLPMALLGVLIVSPALFIGLFLLRKVKVPINENENEYSASAQKVSIQNQ